MRARRSTWLPTALCALAGALRLAGAASAAEPGSPSPRPDRVLQAPPQIVATVCARCHEVESPTRLSPRPDAPNFAAIAREHPEYVEGVLLRPPRAMWSVGIDAADRAEIRTYFAHVRALQRGAPEARDLRK